MTRRDYKRERRAQAQRLYEDGMTAQEIADLIGVSRQRVDVYLREAGVLKRRVGTRRRSDPQARPQAPAGQ